MKSRRLDWNEGPVRDLWHAGVIGRTMPRIVPCSTAALGWAAEASAQHVMGNGEGTYFRALLMGVSGPKGGRVAACVLRNRLYCAQGTLKVPRSGVGRARVMQVATGRGALCREIFGLDAPRLAPEELEAMRDRPGAVWVCDLTEGGYRLHRPADPHDAVVLPALGALDALPAHGVALAWHHSDGSSTTFRIYRNASLFISADYAAAVDRETARQIDDDERERERARTEREAGASG